jgi:rhodanese-related sulfurtransferase
MNRFGFAGMMLFTLLLAAPMASAQDDWPSCPWGAAYEELVHGYVAECFTATTASESIASKAAGLAAPAPEVIPEQGWPGCPWGYGFNPMIHGDVLECLNRPPAATEAASKPAGRSRIMSRTFNQMVGEALADVPSISPVEARSRMAANPKVLMIDVRDAADIAATGIIPGAIAISYGALTYQADNEVPEGWRAPQLADRSRPIITTCIVGPLGALGGKLLHDMGFTDVSILQGGVQAWIDAGLPTQPLTK